MQQITHCTYCANPLRESQNFCQRCGTERSRPSKEAAINVALRFINEHDKGSNLYSKREIGELPKVLWEDELPEQIVTGRYKQKAGLLVATDRRIIFLDKGMLGQLKVEDFRYDTISSIESSRGIIFGSITVYSSGNKAVIDQVPKKQVDSFVTAQRNKLATWNRPKVTAPTHIPFPQPNLARGTESSLDALAKLNELYQQGALTDEEFTRAKERILKGM